MPFPITIADPALAAIMACRCTAIRRPPTMRWSYISPGQQLWVREPFWLGKEFNGLTPLQAADRGARPIFGPVHDGSGVGPRRTSYTLPRIWHRQHLRVTAVRAEPLQTITDAEIAAEGHADRWAWARAWEKGLLVSNSTRSAREGAMSWKANPQVIVLQFEHVTTSVDKPCRRVA